MTRDFGLQPERTFMAWSRTVMALLIDAALVMRSGWLHGRGEVFALGMAVAAVCVPVLMFARRRSATIVEGAALPAALRPGAPLLIAAASGIACAIAMWVVLVRIAR